MFTYKGGSKVTKGTYWNLSKGLRINVAEEQILPGDAAATYLKLPLAIMLLSGPVVGLLYAIMMPIIGLITVAMLAVKGVLSGVYNLTAKTFSFGWRPGNAYLSGKKKKKRDKK